MRVLNLERFFYIRLLSRLPIDLFPILTPDLLIPSCSFPSLLCLSILRSLGRADFLSVFLEREVSTKPENFWYFEDSTYWKVIYLISSAFWVFLVENSLCFAVNPCLRSEKVAISGVRTVWVWDVRVGERRESSRSAACKLKVLSCSCSWGWNRKEDDKDWSKERA